MFLSQLREQQLPYLKSHSYLYPNPDHVMVPKVYQSETFPLEKRSEIHPITKRSETEKGERNLTNHKRYIQNSRQMRIYTRDHVQSFNTYITQYEAYLTPNTKRN